ncbi:MAG: phage/plasmid primase, P4 family [Desulfuromonadales bacterium]
MSDQPTDNVLDLTAAVEARRKEEAEKLAAAAAPEETKTGAGGPDDPEFVMECLANNERGDGVLYAALHRGNFLHIKSSGQWLKWAGHHYSLDRLNEATTAVEQVALKYKSEAGKISQAIRRLEEKKAEAEERAKAAERNEDWAGQDAATAEACRYAQDADRAAARRKDLNKRVDRLRSVRGAANCLAWAHCIEEPVAIIGDEIDKKPMLLPCANGVIDLETGELLPGDPRDLLVKAIPVEYLGIDHVNEDWEKFIAQIHQDDPELIGFIRRLLGYCLTGLDVEHFIACFVGEGRNGKGVLFETVREVMGDLAWAAEPELLLEQKNAKNSAGPSPHIISLHGRRLVIASETDENRRISASQVKRLTGGDTMTGRSPHDRFEINFQPTHKLVLVTNHAPKGLAKDFALFERLIYLDYPLRYVDDPVERGKTDQQNAHLFRKKDPDLKKRLHTNLPGILSWLVRGCLEWQKAGGLKPPPRIFAAAAKIRKDEDHLERFIEDICIREEHAWVWFKTFYQEFARWFSENVDEDKRYIPSKKAIGDQLRRKGYRVETKGGTVTAYGLDVPAVAFEPG